MVKVYFPEEGQIQVHQSRVCSCPPHLPAGFYWYGGNRKSQGRVPQWVQNLFCNEQDEQNSDQEVSESPASAEGTMEQEDGESSAPEPDLESKESQSMVKPRVPSSRRGVM